MSGRNFLTNPFDGLSTEECVKKAEEIVIDPEIDPEELRVRRLQLQSTQEEAFSIVQQKGVLGQWLQREGEL